MATRTDETEIEQVQGVLAEFSRVEAGLAELREKHGNVVYEVTTTAGLEAAKAARAEIRAPRYAVEQVRKAAKAPLLALGKRIDAEAVRITEAILEVERPVDEQIKAEEARRLAEKEARRAAEVERLRQEAAEKLRAEQQQLAAERAAIAAEQARVAEERRVAEAAAAAEREKLAAERAAIEAAAAEQRRKAEAEALAARQKAEAEAAALRKRAADEAAAAKREADLELAAQRKAIADAKAKADQEAAVERAKLKADREAAEAEAKRIEAAQIVEARRLAEGQYAVQAEKRALEKERERRQAREEAERNAAEAEAERLAAERSAIEAREAEGPAAEVVGIDDAAGPLAVWDELKANWETLDLSDHDAVETFCLCCLEQGEQQARQLIEARERIDGVVA